MANQSKTKMGLDMNGYQEFWASAPLEVFERWKGKSVALQPSDDGWQIIDGADDLEQLRDSLLAAGVDLDSVVIDRVWSDEEAAEEFAGGVQLQ